MNDQNEVNIVIRVDPPLHEEEDISVCQCYIVLLLNIFGLFGNLVYPFIKKGKCSEECNKRYLIFGILYFIMFWILFSIGLKIAVVDCKKLDDYNLERAISLIAYAVFIDGLFFVNNLSFNIYRKINLILSNRSTDIFILILNIFPSSVGNVLYVYKKGNINCCLSYIIYFFSIIMTIGCSYLIYAIVLIIIRNSNEKNYDKIVANNNNLLVSNLMLGGCSYACSLLLGFVLYKKIKSIN